MTNSYRRQPFASYGGSQARDKRIGNRRMRRVNRVLMQKDQDSVFRSKDEMMNPYNWTQDGTRRHWSFSRFNTQRGQRLPPTEKSYREWYRWAKAK
jgi:RecB family endonuclease NucS